MRFRGVVYRGHNPRWSWPPVSGEGARVHGGRFNRIGVPAFYASHAPMTALRETGSLGQPMQPILLCGYDVDAEPIFDTWDSSQRRAHAVTDDELRCPDWERTMYSGGVPASQAMADRLITAGYVGMRVPSFVPGARADDVNVVFWSWSDRRPSRIVLIDDESRLPESGK